MNNSALARVGGASVVKEGFGDKSVEMRHETASSAIMARAKAETEARFVMAIQRPRDPDDARTRLLGECKRKSFAERAIFSLPKGDKAGRITGTARRIEGLTIRFAESAIRLWGNLDQTTTTTYDDPFQRQITVSALDLETNSRYALDLTIAKTVERKDAKDRLVLGERQNSYGDTVYIVACTDDELTQKQNMLVSKALRTLALRLIPADILEDCEQQIVQTKNAQIAQDPNAARKAVIDAFASLNVAPSDLKDYLGHDVGTCTPAQIGDLQNLFAALRDNEISWADIVKAETAKREQGNVTASDAVAEKLRKAREARQAKRAPKAEAVATPVAREPGDDGEELSE